MKDLDKFLRIIAMEYMCGQTFDKNVPKPDKLTEMLKKTVSDDLMEKIIDLLDTYSFFLSVYSVTQGLKLAIEIIDDTYRLEG